MQVGDVLPEVELRTAHGETVELGAYLDRLCVIQCWRYYGCMPCRSFLAELRDAEPTIASLGARVIGVGTGADHQARQLMETGTPFPLLVDPDRNLYRVLGMEHIRWYRWFEPKTWTKYLRASRGARQGRLTGDIRQTPGLALVDPNRRVRYLYRGTTLGDYPPVSEVVDVVREVSVS